jgi:drug/metabolite transporter (DMT)-like permease
MKTVGAIVLILFGGVGMATLPAFLADRPDVPHDPLTVLGAFGYYALCLLVGLWNLKPWRLCLRRTGRQTDRSMKN